MLLTARKKKVVFFFFFFLSTRTILSRSSRNAPVTFLFFNCQAITQQYIYTSFNNLYWRAVLCVRVYVCMCVCIYYVFYTIYKTRIQCESLLPFHPFCFLLPLARVAPSSKGHPPLSPRPPTYVSSFRYLLYKVFPILRCNFSSRNVF